jgi:hypothetical protein
LDKVGRKKTRSECRLKIEYANYVEDNKYNTRSFYFVFKSSLFYLTLFNESFFIHIFICAYIVGPFLPPALVPSLSCPYPLLPGRTCAALFSNFVQEKT